MKPFGDCLAVIVVILGTLPGAQAEEMKWHDEAEVMYNDTSSNTDETSISVKNTLTVPFSGKRQGLENLGG